VISLVSAGLSALLVYGIYLLQIRQVELAQTVHVVVPKKFIREGTMLSADMLEYRSILADSFDPRMLRRIEQAEGMETMVPLGSGEPILDWKLDKYHLLPSADQSTFQIPKEYILSVSGGIRAGDKVMLYISGEAAPSARLFDHEVTVASVKSSANMEIDDPEHSNLLSRAKGDLEMMYVSRRDANGPIDQINLNLTEEEWLKLDTLCGKRGMKLVIAFRSSSITELKGGEP
jgi:hypothetical protein